jgi:hypothetical protein
MRAALRTESVDQVSKYYRERYERDYPSLRETAPIERSDDRESNVIRVVAHFALPKFWAWDEKTKSHEALNVARVLEPLLERRSTEGRKLPLAVPYPFHESYRSEFELPFELPLVPVTTTARSAVLDFTFTSAGGANKLTYTYDLAMRGEVIPIALLAAHAAALEKARPTLFRTLTFRPRGPSGANGVAVSLVALCGVLFAIGAIFVYRFEPKGIAPVPAPEVEPRIGGWLVLLGLNVILAPITMLVFLVKSGSSVLTAQFWSALTTPEFETYRPVVAFASMGEIIAREALVAYLAVVALLFLGKRRSFRFHFVVGAVLGASYVVADALLGVGLHVTAEAQKEGWYASLRAVIWAAVWCPYVMRSDRVRRTFVRGARGRSETAADIISGAASPLGALAQGEGETPSESASS